MKSAFFPLRDIEIEIQEAAQNKDESRTEMMSITLFLQQKQQKE